jgi:hypothetical protein
VEILEQLCRHAAFLGSVLGDDVSAVRKRGERVRRSSLNLVGSNYEPYWVDVLIPAEPHIHIAESLETSGVDALKGLFDLSEFRHVKRR